MPFYYDIKDKAVIFSRYEYTTQYMDGQWVDLPENPKVYAIKDGKAILEGTPQEAYDTSPDKMVLATEWSAPVYKPGTTITFSNDISSSQTKKQQELIDALSEEIGKLKSSQVSLTTDNSSQQNLVSSLQAQVDALSASLSGAPSQQTVEQQVIIDKLKEEIANLNLPSSSTIIVSGVTSPASDNSSIIENLQEQIKSLTTLLDKKSETPITVVGSSDTAAPSTGQLTDGVFKFEDESPPLYTFRSSSKK